MIYSGGLDTKYWNTKQIGIPNVLKFCFPMVQKQDGSYFVLLSNCLDHWKTKLLASLDHFIFKHNHLYKTGIIELAGW